MRALCALLLALLIQASPAAAQPRPTWLQTVRETALWSAPSDPAEQFTVLPAGSFVIAQDDRAAGRMLVYFPGDGQTRLSFQHAPDHQPPRWPDPAFPQQIHLDIHVDDIAATEAMVLTLGATRLPSAEPSFRVYADPAGHPFCLEGE